MDGQVSDLTVEILKQIRDGVNLTNARLEQTNARLDSLRDELKSEISELRAETRRGFMEVRASIDTTNKRLDNLIERAGEGDRVLAHRVERLEQRMDDWDARRGG